MLSIFSSAIDVEISTGTTGQQKQHERSALARAGVQEKDTVDYEPGHKDVGIPDGYSSSHLSFIPVLGSETDSSAAMMCNLRACQILALHEYGWKKKFNG
jgi:hypothetical protein